MADPTLLEAEAERAMSGRPAWRVVAACVKGGACPGCGRPAGVRCIPRGFNVCPERVWAQRARERAAGRVPRGQHDGARAFIDAVIRERVAVGAVLWRRPDAEGWNWPDECGTGGVELAAMDAAIACGYVRLAISGGVMPVWVVTEAAVEQAAAWAVEAIEADAAIEQEAKPSAPAIDAAQASADFSSRIGEG